MLHVLYERDLSKRPPANSINSNQDPLLPFGSVLTGPASPGGNPVHPGAMATGAAAAAAAPAQGAPPQPAGVAPVEQPGLVPVGGGSASASGLPGGVLPPQQGAEQVPAGGAAGVDGTSGACPVVVVVGGLQESYNHFMHIQSQLLSE